MWILQNRDHHPNEKAGNDQEKPKHKGEWHRQRGKDHVDQQNAGSPGNGGSGAIHISLTPDRQRLFASFGIQAFVPAATFFSEKREQDVDLLNSYCITFA